MVYTIENDLLNLTIDTKGAEIQSILHKDFGIEYMWSGDPQFWGKKSPVLFPIVGTLKNDTYQYKGRNYDMSRHGFARDANFAVTEERRDSISFTFDSNEETLSKYPFEFTFTVLYALDDNRVNVSYIIRNNGNENMLFSVGGHPAFRVPLVEGTSFDDYFLEFNHFENTGRYPILHDGLIEKNPITSIEHTNKLSLHKSLFYEDALVFKHLNSRCVYILSSKTSHGLKVDFHGFPYLGIWSARDADFVCIEPWCGIADSVDSTGNLEEKEGINVLPAKEVFTRTWHVDLF